MRASTPKRTIPDPSLLTPPHNRRMPRECRAPVLGTGTRASTKGSMAAAGRILEEVKVSNDPAIVNRSNRRATLDIRAICELFDVIHEAITEIELNAPPGAPPEDRRFSVANHPGVKVDLDRWITQVRRVMAERDACKE
ncbi:hypothetical protein E4U58_001510 [Claviceps cyperi]|nr:hypothetical protein E4U58_001510 [Claviceps cyperi]